MDCVFRASQIQLYKIANHALSATGSAFVPQVIVHLCMFIHMLVIIFSHPLHGDPLFSKRRT